MEDYDDEPRAFPCNEQRAVRERPSAADLDESLAEEVDFAQFYIVPEERDIQSVVGDIDGILDMLHI